MHDPKGLVIAAMVAACAYGTSASAQQDAAQKAREGGIDHWIEYYKGQQSRMPEPPQQEPAERLAPTTPGISTETTGKSGEPVKKDTAPK